MVSEMKESTPEFDAICNVESPKDLVIELDPSDVGQWQSTRRNCAIAKAAIYVDEAHRLAETDV